MHGCGFDSSFLGWLYPMLKNTHLFFLYARDSMNPRGLSCIFAKTLHTIGSCFVFVKTINRRNLAAFRASLRFHNSILSVCTARAL